MPKSEPDQQSLQLALQRIETAYWYEVDTNWGQRAHDFYAPDGVFDMGLGSKPHAGRDAIAQFYAWRKSRGTRTARHVISNVLVDIGGERDATLRCIMCLYAADGEPILPSNPPIMIADVVSAYVLDSDGSWRVRSRTLIPVFMGGEKPTIITDE